MKKLLVVGATGDVGQGIVAAAMARGWRVAGAGRSQAMSAHPKVLQR
jgi:uncharacterized protein YbjT (DUF2867 family)